MPEPTTTIALRVDGGADWEWDPDVALLTIDAAWVKQVLAQMAQVAGLKAEDNRICAVERSLDPLRWRTDPDTRDGRLWNHDWAGLDIAEVLALRPDEEVGVTVVAVTQVTTEDTVYWRACSKHRDRMFVTVAVTRHDLEESFVSGPWDV